MLYKLGKYNEALKYYKESLSFIEEVGNNFEIADLNINIGKTFSKIGNHSKAEFFINKGYELAITTNSLLIKKNAYKAYSELYSSKKDFNKAFDFMLKYSEVKDSLSNKEIQRNIANIQVKYYLNKSNDKLIYAKKERENAEAKLIRNVILLIVLAVSVLGVVIIFLLYRQFKIREKANKELKNSLKEKEILIAEIHHRVKNNLAIISGLIQLQILKFDEKRAFDALKNTKSRIHSFALIHENLYHNEKNAGIDFNIFLNKQIARISKLVNKENIKTVVKVEEIKLDLNNAVSLGLITNEILLNAYTHAFTDNDEGTIKVDLYKDNDTCVLEISDNGKGMPETVNITDVNTAGFLIVAIYIKQMKADFSINIESGTSIKIRFKPKKMKVWK
ncbi:MAG: tetratricopeptide repeat protein [bacterium]|nr:tetratricopeptide repeat protein [bacterium]